MLPLTDYTLIFTILLLVIMVAPLLAAKLRIPDLVLILLAGAALGPMGFGVLQRSTAIMLFGEIGLIYIMFLAGLEIDLYQFSRTKRRSVGFGLLTFAVPQVVGTLVVREVLGLSWPSSLLMASMFASHTLLSYPVASRLGIQRTEPVTITVGATIITDTLALLVLALVADTATGVAFGPRLWIEIGAGLAILVVLAWWVIPRVCRWFFQNVTEAGGTQFLFVLTVTCACGYLAHFARMHSIVGAFLAGAAFNRLIPEHSPLMNRVQFVGHNLFIPFFLISVGMLVDYRVLLAEPRTWMVIGVMVGCVVITKYFAAWIGQATMGYSRDDRHVMFGLSVVQAAATLAAVMVGFELGILDDAALNGAIAMILVTCPLGSWVVDRAGRRVARHLLTRPVARSEEQRLLLSVANPASAARLMDLAFLLRDPAVPGGIYPVTIVREETDLDEAVARGETLLAQCMAHASSADVSVMPSVRVDLNPSDGIVRAATELRAGQVLVGWGGEMTAGARIFGTVNRNLIDHCGPRLMLCRLMRPLNTTKCLHLPFPPLAEHRADLPSLLRQSKLLAKQIGAPLTVYLAGEPATSLRQSLEDTAPSCAMTFFCFDTWAEARSKMLDELHEDDLIMIPLERRNTVLWTPTLDRLPDRLAASHPGNNLIVIYPAMAEAADVESYEPRLLEKDDESALQAVDFPKGTDAQSALQMIARQAFPHDAATAETAWHLLLQSARQNPVELLPGVVLVHAHCGQEAESKVLIGKGKIGWPFPEPASPPRVLVTLLSPKGNAPTVHLRALAGLARRFHGPDVAERIDQAASAREVCRILDAANAS